MTTATVRLWGTTVGYVSMAADERYARFEYDPDFVQLGIQLAPLKMPLRNRQVYQFTDLEKRSFHGLPGLLSDSLPDKFGNRLIDVWLARTGRKPDEFDAVDRLCYTGVRGMGALEYEPATGGAITADKKLEIQELVELASVAFADKAALDTRLTDAHGEQALLDIMSVGTSAGGARAKAVIAFNPRTKQVRSGQGNLSSGFEHWLIKFDGVEFNGDWGVADPAGYGLLEYSYSQMAEACGITMMECKLLSENGRNHFMTRRFDRDDKGGKKFVQTLGAMAHFDYWESGQYSYEQVFMTMKELDMPKSFIEEQFRRTVFNLVACNQDDHVKNIAFLMDRQGSWELSPAYDLCHAEGSDFTRFHQLSVNGKTDNFVFDDLKQLASYAGLPRGREKRVLERTVEVFSGWGELSMELGIDETLHEHVTRTLRLEW